MIKEDVELEHLRKYPEERPFLNRIEPDFDITWAKNVKEFNAAISFYFLKPKNHIEKLFGFNQEIVLGYSAFPVIEARAIQAVDKFFKSQPALGRVDQSIAIIASKDGNIYNWLKDYVARNPQSKTYVAINHDDLIKEKDSWFIRNTLMKQLYHRDLFDYTLPIDNDMFFFGRQRIIPEYLDAIRKSENRGLFGLRKTGKTSVFFKLRRSCAEAGIVSIYYDCKLSSVYDLSGEELLNQICTDASSALAIKVPQKMVKAIEKFKYIVSRISENKRLCIMLDEVEYIYDNPLAPHWIEEFVPFWNNIWSIQSQYRVFSFIISGVNASICESGKVNNADNPLFSIVKPKYLTGLEEGELFSLTATFGKRMGLVFEGAAVKYLYQRYGGHPLLTRMVCSQINNSFSVREVNRPIKVTVELIKKNIDQYEEEIQFYCGHITSVLEEFYKLEYEMLEMLAIGNIVDFLGLASDLDLVRHLKYYGLIDISSRNEPKFVIPIIQKYIVNKWKKKTGSKVNRYVVPEERRLEFVRGRISSIIRDIRYAEKHFSKAGLPSLYDGRGASEAEMLNEMRACETRDDAVAVFSQMSRSLVEPIDGIGKKAGKVEYFFRDIKSSYVYLYEALNRIRAYRNWMMHLELNILAEESFVRYVNEDFYGEKPGENHDGWFIIQSVVLDALVVAIQSELAKIT